MKTKFDPALTRLIQTANRYPVLSQEREQEIAIAWRDRGIAPRSTNSSAAICVLSFGSPAALPAMACRSPISSPKAMSD